MSTYQERYAPHDAISNWMLKPTSAACRWGGRSCFFSTLVCVPIDRARVVIRRSRTAISTNPNSLPVSSNSLLLEVERRAVCVHASDRRLRVPVRDFVFRSDDTFHGPVGSAWSVAADTECALSSV